MEFCPHLPYDLSWDCATGSSNSRPLLSATCPDPRRHVRNDTHFRTDGNIHYVGGLVSAEYQCRQAVEIPEHDFVLRAHREYGGLRGRVSLREASTSMASRGVPGLVRHYVFLNSI